MKKLYILLLILIMLVSVTSCSDKNNTYESWHLNSMKIDYLWNYSQGSSQCIAFIDTGISDKLYKHYKNRIISSYNVIEDNQNITDKHGHGTEMVSVACGDGFMDVYGISPKSKIIIIKAVSDEGKTNNEYLYKGLVYAQENHATIVNISLGGFKNNDSVIEQINKMTNDGISIIAAGGDYGNKDLLFPANQKNVISVEALNEDNKLWEYSNTSNNSVVRFPGENIICLTIKEGDIIKDTSLGTSQASAVVSGYIALIKDFYFSNNKVINNDSLIDLMKKLNTFSEKNIDYSLAFNSANI